MDAIQPLPGERVLDIGCWIGGTPRALSRLVGTGGEVVRMDLLQAAIDVARRDPGLPGNVSFLCGDLQSTVDVCSRVGALGKILREHPELRGAAIPPLEQVLRPLDGPKGPALRAATWVVTAIPASG